MGTEFSPFGPGGVGLHLTVNPQTKPRASRDIHGRPNIPANRNIGNLYRQHGLTLSDRELKALSVSREHGVKTINNLLGMIGPFRALSADDRLNLAMTAADVLLEHNIQGQLSREVPTALDREEQTAARLQSIFQNMQGAGTRTGNAPSLLGSVPVGASLTIHLPVDWL